MSEARQRIPQQSIPVAFGFEDQWKAFGERHSEFFSRVHNLTELLHKAYLIQSTKTGTEAVVVFVMGRVCCEEFYEIMTTAANGYGLAALRLLRGLYERAVTMLYLCDHPGEVDAFMEYYHVAQYKMLKAIQDTFGPDTIKKEAVEEAEQDYARVKGKFMVTQCKDCGTERMNHAWHKLDVVSMAKQTPLGKLIVPAYYVPMSHAHTTVRSVLARIEETGEHGMSFNPDAQPKEADWAFRFAHVILLEVVRTHINYFELGEAVEELYKTCIEDYKAIWGTKEPNNMDEAVKA